MSKTDYDCVIVGGGFVGLTLGMALSKLGNTVLLLEAKPTLLPAQVETLDYRAIALSSTSRQYLKSVGLWPEESEVLIDSIHVSEKGCFGFTRLEAKQLELPAVGYIQPAGQLLVHMATQLENTAVDVKTAARMQDFVVQEGAVEISYQQAEGTHKVSAQLLIGAEGMRSPTRQALGITVEAEDYGKKALIAHVTLNKPGKNIAYERFTEQGPLALLPLGAHRYATVWSLSPERADELLAASDTQFLSALQAAFGYRLGRFSSVCNRQYYPLHKSIPNETYADRVLLLGSSASHIHPAAGQGLNLALRDIATFSEQLIQQHDIGELSFLENFARLRATDRKTVQKATEWLVRLYSNQSLLGKVARSVGMSLLDIAKPMKKSLVRRASGIYDGLPDSMCSHFLELGHDL